MNIKPKTIKKYRQKLNMSIRKIALYYKVHPVTWNRWELGNFKPEKVSKAYIKLKRDIENAFSNHRSN